MLILSHDDQLATLLLTRFEIQTFTVTVTVDLRRMLTVLVIIYMTL